MLENALDYEGLKYYDEKSKEYIEEKDNTALEEAKTYTDTKVANLVGTAPETLNTLEELAEAIEEHQEVADLLTEAIGNKASKTDLDSHAKDTSIHITQEEKDNLVTKESVNELEQTISELNATNTASGSPILLTDSADGTLIDFKAYGRSTQKQYSGKNVLQNTATSQTNNGITFTPVYDDNGSLLYINANGTADSNAHGVLTLNTNISIKKGTYILSGCPSGGSATTYYVQAFGTNNYNTGSAILDTGNGYTATFADDDILTRIIIVVYKGTTVNNLKFYPMISATGGTYEPYVGGVASPNPDYPQAIDSVADSGWFDGELLQGFYNSSNGTHSSSNTSAICSKNSIPCKDGDNIKVIYPTTLLQIRITYYKNGTYVSFNIKDNVSEASFTVPTNATEFHISIIANDTVSPTTAKPITVTINGKYALIVKSKGKNLLKNTATTQTTGGLTFTVNDDKSIKVSGTVSGANNLYLNGTNKDLLLPSGTYVLSGMGNVSGSTEMVLRIYDKANLIVDLKAGTPEKTFTLTADTNVLVYINFNTTGVTYSGTIYPMIRLVDTDGTYESYKETVSYIPLNEPLRSIGNVTDEIDLERGVKISKIKETTVKITRIVTMSNGNVAGLVENVSDKYYGKAGAYCSKCVYDNNINPSFSSNTFYENPVNFVIVGNPNDTFESLKERYDGALLYYVLAEPITETIEPVDITTYNNVTYLTASDNAEMEVEYYSNSNVGRRLAHTNEEMRAQHEYLQEQITTTQTNKADHEEIIGENLLIYPYYNTTHTENGITWTDNGDGTVRVSAGTATSNCFFVFRHAVSDDTISLTLLKGSYTISGGTEKVILRVYKVENGATTTQLAVDNGNGSTFTIEEDTRISVQLYIVSGTSVTATTIKPMLEKGTIAHPYQPYTKSRDGIIEQIVVDNLIDSNFKEGWTRCGTGTYESGKAIFTKGSDTSGASYYYKDYNLEKGKTYTVSAKINTSDEKGAYISVMKYTGSFANVVSPHINNSKCIETFTVPSDAEYIRIIFALYNASATEGTQITFSEMMLEEGAVAHSYQPYNLSHRGIVEQIVTDNLLIYPYKETSHVQSDVTWTDLGDGTVKANGTNTSATQSIMDCRTRTETDNPLILPPDTYTVSGCPSGGSSSTYYIQVGRTLNGSFDALGYDYGNGLTFTITENTQIQVQCVVAKSASVSNIVFKPMLEVGTIAHPYQPYNLSRQKLREDIDDSSAMAYGTCTTAAATSEKVVTITDNDNWKLKVGATVVVKYTNTNTAANCTLNVNNTGAKSIWYNNAVYTANSNQVLGYANRHTTYIYDGTYWVWIGQGIDNNSTYTNAGLGQGYGTCTTTALTTDKVVTLSSYALTVGGVVSVKFTYAVPANATMNINNRGAKNIFYRGGKIVAGIINAGDIATFMYDGTQYHLISIDKGILNNTAKGALGYNSSTSKDLIPTVSTLAFWDGAYSGTSSNLAYCNQGAFGTIVTKNTGDYLPSSGGNLTGQLTIENVGLHLLSGASIVYQGSVIVKPDSSTLTFCGNNYSKDIFGRTSSGVATELVGTLVSLSSSDGTITNRVIATHSDARLKTDSSILDSSSEVTDKYLQMWKKLQPRRFKMTEDQESGKYNLGYFAQEVEESLYNSGLNENDFNGLVKVRDYLTDTENIDDSEYFENLYALSYEQCHMLDSLKLRQVVNEIIPEMQKKHDEEKAELLDMIHNLQSQINDLKGGN